MSEKKNVLLLCLSPLQIDTKNKRHMHQYSYKFQGAGGANKEETLFGMMTNQASTESIIRELRAKKERLDRIVILCSKKVREESISKSVTEEKWGDLQKEFCDREQLESDIDPTATTHLQLYKTLINTIANRISEDYKNQPIEYEEIAISDDIKKDEELASAVTDAVKKVAYEKNNKNVENIDLYIDFNGGPRHIAFMILSISNLLENRNVNLQKVMTTKFDRNTEVIKEIKTRESIFATFDLVSGINEYITYGRTKTLRKYFPEKENTDIDDILNAMQNFSNNLQLCRVDVIMNERKDLKELLEDFSKKDDAKQNTKELLFQYVIKDIIKGYEGLLTGELPEMIEWCVKKDFIQQALTFVSERMPGYFWESGIYKATPDEEKEYKAFLSWNNGKNRYATYTNPNSLNSKNAYDWMIRYLSHSKDDAHNLRADQAQRSRVTLPVPQIIDLASNTIFYTLTTKIPSKTGIDGIINDRNNNLNAFSQIAITNNIPINAKKQAATLIWHLKNSGRAETKVDAGDQRYTRLLYEIILLYYTLKEQRNETNHAAGQANAAWTYEELCDALQKMVEALRDINERY